ncbi:PrsW family intramembrane metalloprotease [Microcoleus sp. FACHB-831]|uniref:PrsW family intramembrane metalloprotease n=1 Tax=Microcoleus sp. FACHB-831 TaxID=2692827 RepID=UPI00168A3B05|nr:PrsW family intramembrane metalloprotease [Microcoleus sp. FACHB-831]MBD1922305.1 PrsW family intramembrane metalloprotease [Microcoleus sp. FACHB-831]
MDKFLITAVLIAIPTYLYIRIVISIDRFEKEPTRYLIGAFLWGAVPAVIIGIIAQLILDIPVEEILGTSLTGQFITTAINAPITEEILKGAVVAILYLWFRREFDGWVDGIVYGAMAGFGFAYVENIIYLLGTKTWEEWVGLFILRVIALGFMHGFWTALTGIGFGVARHMHNPWMKVWAIATGLIAAMFAHLIHNGGLILAEASGGATILVVMWNYGFLLILMIILGFVAARHDRKMLKTYLSDEVPHIISAVDYEGLCNTTSNALARFRAAPKQKRAFIQAAAELAQKKFQLMKMGEEGGNSTEIKLLREELKRMRG